MEIPDELLKEALDHGWVAMALHERQKIAGLSKDLAGYEFQHYKDLKTIQQLTSEFVMDVDKADMVIDIMEKRSHNKRLTDQRKEIRALHKKIERLEEQLNGAAGS